jgi:hypothetical protein
MIDTPDGAIAFAVEVTNSLGLVQIPPERARMHDMSREFFKTAIMLLGRPEEPRPALLPFTAFTWTLSACARPVVIIRPPRKEGCCCMSCCRRVLLHACMPRDAGQPARCCACRHAASRKPLL